MKQTMLFLMLIGMLLGIPLPRLKAQITDTWTFSTLPANGILSGNPGSTLGWGYTLRNQSNTYWLYVYGFRSSAQFLNGTTTVLFDYPVIAPGATLSLPYNAAAGLVQLTWSATAPIDFTNSGNFIVDGAWYDNDPFEDGQFIDLAGSHSSAYHASVTAPTAFVTGVITLQNSANQVQSITFEFRPTDSSAAFSRTVTLNSNGEYSLTDVPRKGYSVRIKGTKWLAKVLSVDTMNGNVSNVNATLRAGDANDDNAADISDLLLLIAHYNQVAPSSNYLNVADFNDDDSNDIADLLLLVDNYNQLGD